MTDYYTTKSLATAAAAIEQGFEGCESIEYGNKSWDKGFHVSECCFRYCKWRFPKTPHNVGLEVPIVGDYGGDGKYSGFVKHVTDDSVIIVMPDHERGIPKQDFIIEKRNNKPFPVWDKEGV